MQMSKYGTNLRSSEVVYMFLLCRWHQGDWVDDGFQIELATEVWIARTNKKLMKEVRNFVDELTTTQGEAVSNEG